MSSICVILSVGLHKSTLNTASYVALKRYNNTQYSALISSNK